MKRYTDQDKVDTRSGFGAGCFPHAVKRGISNVCMIFLLSLTASCTLCNTLDSILNPGRKKLNWTVEYELNGEATEDAGYVYVHPPMFSSPPYYEDDYWALSFGYDGFYAHNCKWHVPMSIQMTTPDLFFLFTVDEKSRFMVNHSYSFNEKCKSVYNAGDTSMNFYMEYEVLNGSYSFEVKQGCKESTIIVHFDVDEIITGLPEWYEGPFSVGDRITIKNGRLEQHGIDEGSIIIDYLFEL